MSTDVEKQEGQKTVVSFAAGLLIGGLLVWAFSGSPETNETRTVDVQNSDDTEEVADTDMEDTDSAPMTDTEDEPEATTPAMELGDASADIASTEAGSTITLDGATFPTSEGWIGVRSYAGGEFGNILGVSRYSNEQGLIPTEIELLVPTQAGSEYAIVFFDEDGDRNFNPALDAQLMTDPITFTAE
jgi:hypothetical protein